MNDAPKFPAIYIAHTPPGPTYACADHAEKIKALFSFMGAYVNFTPAPNGSQCCNCINEAKKGKHEP